MKSILAFVGSERWRVLLKPLLAVAVSLALAIVFALLASEVLEGETSAVDSRVADATRRLRAAHPWITAVARDLSGLGSFAVLGLFTCAASGYLVLLRARMTAVLLAASVLMGSLSNSLFKTLFGRARPDPALAEYTLTSLSFPSGHAAMSAIVFLSFGVLVANARPSSAERMYLLGVAAVLTLLVGASRVMLGVHWTTDVLGGWAFGAAWASMWLLIARILERQRGMLERA